MGHVDDAHLAEDDGQPQRHQHIYGEEDQSCKTLHRENRAEIANRIIAEHRFRPPSSIRSTPAIKRFAGAVFAGVDFSVHAGKLLWVARVLQEARCLTGSPWGTDPARPNPRSRKPAH